MNEQFENHNLIITPLSDLKKIPFTTNFIVLSIFIYKIALIYICLGVLFLTNNFREDEPEVESDIKRLN